MKTEVSEDKLRVGGFPEVTLEKGTVEKRFVQWLNVLTYSTLFEALKSAFVVAVVWWKMCHFVCRAHSPAPSWHTVWDKLFPHANVQSIVWLVISSWAYLFMQKNAETIMVAFCFNYFSSINQLLCVQTTWIVLSSSCWRQSRSMSMTLSCTYKEIQLATYSQIERAQILCTEESINRKLCHSLSDRLWPKCKYQSGVFLQVGRKLVLWRIQQGERFPRSCVCKNEHQATLFSVSGMDGPQAFPPPMTNYFYFNFFYFFEKNDQTY